jgi:hypothetical protein
MADGRTTQILRNGPYEAERGRMRPLAVEQWRWDLYLGLVAYDEALIEKAHHHFRQARDGLDKRAGQAAESQEGRRAGVAIDYNHCLCKLSLGDAQGIAELVRRSHLETESSLESVGLRAHTSVLFLVRLVVAERYLGQQLVWLVAGPGELSGPSTARQRFLEDLLRSLRDNNQGTRL